MPNRLSFTLTGVATLGATFGWFLLWAPLEVLFIALRVKIHPLLVMLLAMTIGAAIFGAIAFIVYRLRDRRQTT